jgi:hypothetical protein
LVDGNVVFASGVNDENYGIFFSSSSDFNVSCNNITTNGTSENYGIYLFEMEAGSISQSNITARGSEGDNYGIYAYGSVGVNVSGNGLVTGGTDNNYGVFLTDSSDNCLVDGNVVSAYGSDSDNYGVFFSSSSGVVVSGNNITTNGTSENHGIYAHGAPRNIIDRNRVAASGISGNFGIRLSDGSDNSLISRNNITTASNRSSGMYLSNSVSANITDNIIQATKNMSFAVQLENSANNSIFNNVFNTTERQVNISPSGEVNNFSTALVNGTNIIGYSYIGGNYYSNSTVGGLNGFTCSDNDRNGICDSAYQIAANSTDYYPLTVPPPVPAEEDDVEDTSGIARGDARSGGGTIIKKAKVAAPSSPNPPAPAPAPAASGSPKQLFDIKLELERSVLYDSRNLAAWVSFENFGKETTPVNLTYIILNGSGDEVYTKKAFITVQTERFVIESFSDLHLGQGKYTLVLRTSYSSNVTDYFRQNFEITDVLTFAVNYISDIMWWAILIIILAFPLDHEFSGIMRRKKSSGRAHKSGMIITLVLLVSTAVLFAVNLFIPLPWWLFLIFSLAVFGDVLFVFNWRGKDA